ncbi:hypothetical protein WDU94_010132 [Cyamophila willieti]
MNLSPSVPARWMILKLVLLLQLPDENKVDGCIEMLMRTFTHMIPGPNGIPLLGITHFDPNVRAPCPCNYQIEAQPDRKRGIVPDEDEYTNADYNDDIDEYDTIYKKQKRRDGNNEIEAHKILTSSRRGIQRSNSKEDTEEHNKNKLKSNLKVSRRHNLKPNTRLLGDSLGLLQRQPIPKPAQEVKIPKRSLYDLELKTKDLNSKNSLYKMDSKSNSKSSQKIVLKKSILDPKKNSYKNRTYKSSSVQGDKDLRNGIKNSLKTSKPNQPLIDMMKHVLGTMQLTSELDYKRAKESELRDRVKHELMKLNGK